MAQEAGYRQQVAPAAPVNLPGASPAAFGAGIGAGIAQVGEALGRSEFRARQVEREQRRGDEWADFSAKFSQLRLDGDITETEARSRMAPGGAGYVAGRTQWLTERTQGLIDGITEDSVRRQAQAQLDEYRGRVTAQAHAVESGARIAKRTTDVQTQIDTAANRIDRDPSTYEQEAPASLTAIEGMEDVPADVRDKLHRLAEEKLAIAVINGTTRSNPQAGLVLLKSGAFDNVLSPEQVEQLRTRGEILIHKQEIAVERAQAKAEAQQKESEATLLQQVNDGVELDPSMLVSAAGAARARGDETRAYQLTTAAAAMKLAAPYADANVDQLTRGMGQIEADAGWRSDPIKVAQHDWLEKRRGQLRDADPAIAAPDWQNAGSIAAFEQAIRTDAASRGATPQYLTRDMAAQLKPMMGSLSGRAEVLELVNRMSPAAAAAAARQLAPDDRAFQGAAMLSDPVRRMVLSGQEALKTKATPITDAKVRPIFQTYASPALKAFEGDTAATVRETADALAAELAARRGAQQVDEDLYREALHLALGGGARGGQPTGGLGWVENASGRGARIVLPTDMTQREFDTKLARLNGPLNAWWGGKQLTAAELRQHFVPVTVGDGLYEWEDAQGRAVKAKNGTDARLDIRSRR